MHFLNCYVSHGSATRFLKGGKKYHIYFIDNLLLFPTVKHYSKLVNIWWSYCKNLTPWFFETQCNLEVVTWQDVTMHCYHLRSGCGGNFVVSVCLCLFLTITTITFESLNIRSFCSSDTSSEYLGQVHIWRSSG